MHAILIASLLVTSQTVPSATQKTGTWTIGVTKTSRNFHTGYIPFEVEFQCTFDFVGPENGCYVVNELDLNTIVGSVYPYRGQQPTTDTPKDVQFAEIHISGMGLHFAAPDGGVSYSSFMPLNEIYVDAKVASLDTNGVYWFCSRKFSRQSEHDD